MEKVLDFIAAVVVLGVILAVIGFMLYGLLGTEEGWWFVGGMGVFIWSMCRLEKLRK